MDAWSALGCVHHFLPTWSSSNGPLGGLQLPHQKQLSRTSWDKSPYSPLRASWVTHPGVRGQLCTHPHQYCWTALGVLPRATPASSEDQNKQTTRCSLVAHFSILCTYLPVSLLEGLFLRRAPNTHVAHSLPSGLTSVSPNQPGASSPCCAPSLSTPLRLLCFASWFSHLCVCVFSYCLSPH